MVSSWWIRKGLHILLILCLSSLLFLTIEVILRQNNYRGIRTKVSTTVINTMELDVESAALTDEIDQSEQSTSDTVGDLLDNININCNALTTDDKSEIERLKLWTYDHTRISKVIQTATNKCDTLKSLFSFANEPYSQEEEEYPLAYGLLVHKNFAQVMFMLSSIYQPQNEYCIAVSGSANEVFKELINSTQKCFPNVKIMFRPPIKWGSYEIINTTYACFEYLTKLNSPWKYYQYLSGVDAPLKTNLEMVRIFKALNETINYTITPFPKGRARKKPLTDSPLRLYKSMLSALLPRSAADFLVNAVETQKLLEFLKGTVIADESFWGTVSGNYKDFPIPGGLNNEEWLNYTIEYNKTHKITQDIRVGEDTTTTEMQQQTLWNSIRSYYISRYQIWRFGCKGKIVSYSCLYGVEDYTTVIKQPHLIAHKMYIDYQPATLFCALKEVRWRTLHPLPFDTTLYTELPQVELKRGVSYEKLSHPEWMISTMSAG